MTPGAAGASKKRYVSSVVAVGLIAAGLFAAFLAPAAQSQSTVNVSIKGFAFNPPTITVVLGVNNTVTWTNNDPVHHTVTGSNGAWGSNVNPGIAPNATFTYTFTAAGTFGYHCSIHTYMKGTVIVLAGSSSGGIPEFPFTGIAVIAITVLLLASYALARQYLRPRSAGSGLPR
jgi:plastocyanin